MKDVLLDIATIIDGSKDASGNVVDDVEVKAIATAKIQ